MRRQRWSAVLAAIGLAASVALGVSQAEAQGAPIRVGSKNFTESIVFAHFIAEVLEADGFKVDRKLQLGGTGVIHQALVSGDIDVYPEYTGTGLTAILKLPAQSDPKAVFEAVKGQYAEKFKLVWTPTYGFNDTYALAMKRSEAEKRKIKSLSDLTKQAGELRFGSTQEFLVRPDAIPGLEKTYGLKFKEQRGMDPGLVYAAIGNSGVDVIVVFTTDARIKSMDLLVLEDDKNFFPSYQLASVVRQSTLDSNPKLAQSLAKLSGNFTEDEVIEINGAIDLDKKPPADVAKDWLRRKGIIK